MRISEIFHSIQGEGQFAGIPSVFVRTTGCNLRCWFCDTAYTSWMPEGSDEPWETVLAKVQSYECEHVVITGGEPMLQQDVVPLTRALRFSKNFVTIETAGTVYLPVYADLMSISPKRSNSTPTADRALPPGIEPNAFSITDRRKWAEKHEQIRDNRDVVIRLNDEYQCQLKFVIDHPEDLDDVRCYLDELPNLKTENVWLMPQAITVERLSEKSLWLKEFADRQGYRFSPRMHIELFGNVRGK